MAHESENLLANGKPNNASLEAANYNI